MTTATDDEATANQARQHHHFHQTTNGNAKARPGSAGLFLDPIGAALLEGHALGNANADGDLVTGSTSVSNSPVRGSINGNGSVNTSVSANGGGGVSVDALLGQQMQSLQAESRSRVAPLLVELEATTSQAADLHAMKQTLLVELQSVETRLAAALARSHALQSSVEEHQRVYDHKLQTLIALVPPAVNPPPPPAQPGTGSNLLLQRHVSDLLGHLHDMEQQPNQTSTSNSTSSHHHITSHDPQTWVPSLTRQVPGRVSASEVRMYICYTHYSYMVSRMLFLRLCLSAITMLLYFLLPIIQLLFIRLSPVVV